MTTRLPTRILMTALLLGLPSMAMAQGTVSSYATSAIDEIGSTGVDAVALGVADYFFVNDDGLGFGGTNTDVFDVGESATLAFSTAMQNVPSQHDLVISAYVGGLGETDNATVQVEVSSDGSTFSVADTFDTAEARDRDRDRQENDHPGVKHFWIDFGAADAITHVRLTNLAGTAEGFRLDSVEGLHPDTDSAHAFEIRFERYRVDSAEHFLVRLKNISDSDTGLGITGFFLERSPPYEWLEQTIFPLLASDEVGSMICILNCLRDRGEMTPGVPSATWAFSLDGSAPAPAGIGLEPGRYVTHQRFEQIDIDTPGQTYLTHFTFWVEFSDGERVDFDWNNDVVGFHQIGALYQKYTYYNANPALSGPRPVHHYEYVEMIQVPTIASQGRLVLVGTLMLAALFCLIRRHATATVGTSSQDV